MEFLSKAGGLNNNPHFKEECFHFYGILSCAEDRLLKYLEEAAVRMSPCSCPDLNAERDPDSEVCLDEKIEEINPGALPTELLDHVTREYYHLKLHTENRHRKSRLG